MRDNGLPESRTTAIAGALRNAEHMSGAARTSALKSLATSLDHDAANATDATRVRLLAGVVKGLESKS